MKTLYYVVLILQLSALLLAADTTRIFVGWDGTRYCPPNSGYKLGMALSGGGARGLAQVGVIKALEKAGFHINAIAGTSMGGIIGGLYASGYSADSLEKIVESIDFSSLFSDRPSRTNLFLTQRSEKERYLLSIRFEQFRPYIPQGLTSGQKLTDLITGLTLKANYISAGNFSALEIPFRTVTTDIVTGREVVLDTGNLADAMRATMAFPLAFTGVEKGEMILMDGGMLDPIPVDVVQSMRKDLDLVIAVNTTSDLKPKSNIKNPMDIADQVTTIMALDKKEAGLARADIVITPEIQGHYSSEFDKDSFYIKQGYTAGIAALPEIRGKLERNCSSDTLYLVSVNVIDPHADFDISRVKLPSEGIIRRIDLERAVNDLYTSQNLFSISGEIITDSLKLLGYYPAILNLKLTTKPRLQDIHINIRGNDVIADSVIEKMIRGNRTYLTSEDIDSLSRDLRKLYLARGIDLANIRHLEYLPNKQTLDVYIDEAVVRRIEITGNQRTKSWLIRSNLPAHEGKPLSSKDARKGIDNIYSTGLFDRVTMNVLPGDSGAVIRINVEERKFTQMRLGWHWHNEYRSEEFIELLDDNLFGTGQEYLMHAQYANRRQKYEISLKADRFFSTYFTYHIQGYFNILNRDIYNARGDVTGGRREERQGLEFALGQQIARLGTVTGEIRWEEIKNKYTPDGFRDRNRLRALTLRSLVETIDRHSFPNRGKRHLFYAEYNTDILGGQDRYTKLFSSIESYFPFGRRFNLHPKLSIGWTDTGKEIPISEKFYIGGPYSFTGFHTDELYGDKMFLGNMELRHNLPYHFYLTARFDIGEVYASSAQIKLRHLRQGYGFSASYDSPIGPIDLGYGKSGTHPGQTYLNIGLAF